MGTSFGATGAGGVIGEAGSGNAAAEEAPRGLGKTGLDGGNSGSSENPAKSPRPASNISAFVLRSVESAAAAVTIAFISPFTSGGGTTSCSTSS